MQTKKDACPYDFQHSKGYLGPNRPKKWDVPEIFPSKTALTGPYYLSPNNATSAFMSSEYVCRAESRRLEREEKAEKILAQGVFLQKE